MSAVINTIPREAVAPLPILAADEILYPESHDDDMGESDLHYWLINYLSGALRMRFSTNAEVYVAANLNIYYEPGRPELYFAPDVMVSFGVAKLPRQVYKLWEEQTFPQVIIEVASDRTWKNDLTDKVKFYGDMGAEEYYVLDSKDFLHVPLIAYRLENGRLKSLYLPEDRVFSPRLGMEIQLTPNGFRFFNPQTQEFLPTLEEAEAKAAEVNAENARLRAELARLKGETR
jgi:Uma2 family endonuclease